MAESIFARVRRIISSRLEDAVDAMEQAGGSGVMREAIREVDRVIDEVRAEADAVAMRRHQAARQERLFRERLSGLEDKARFALGEGRQDLAEAAIARQLDFEAQAERLQVVQAEAATEAARLEECLVALRARKTQMDEALAAFAATQQRGVHTDAPERASRWSERSVERAEAAFDRAMAGAGGVSSLARSDAQAAVKVAEIDAMQRNATIAQRLAALRMAHAG